MGKKDLWQSDYFDDKRRFADMINGAFFKGKQVIKAEELEEADSQLVHHEKSGEEWKPFVTNHKLNLFDYHEYEDFSFFKTENRILFELLSCAKDEVKMEKIIKQNQCVVDRETMKAILGMLGININLNKIMTNVEEGVGYDMCKAWDDHKESGRQEGLQEGLVALVNILSTMLPDFDTIYNKIVSEKKYQNVSREQVEKYYAK